jgi:hypothetical protein
MLQMPFNIGLFDEEDTKGVKVGLCPVPCVFLVFGVFWMGISAGNQLLSVQKCLGMQR